MLIFQLKKHSSPLDFPALVSDWPWRATLDASPIDDVRQQLIIAEGEGLVLQERACILHALSIAFLH